MKLNGWTLQISDPVERTRIVQTIRESQDDLLVLDTCQRLECYGYMQSPLPCEYKAVWHDEVQCFERLARIAAGLESRVLGELEILGQFRQAYKFFKEQHRGRLNCLDRIFQDALALARKARRNSGIDANLISIGAIAARDMLDALEQQAPIAVIGSGSVASSVARYLSKRGNHPVRVISRCPENAIQLAQRVGGFGGGLDELSPLLEGTAGIICATAAPHPVLYAHHLDTGTHRLHVTDLGVPADCDVSLHSLSRVRYQSLEDVETKAQLNTQERHDRARRAAEIIQQGAREWAAKR